MKPILFNTEMVQAILEGRKTQTRRVMKNTLDHKFEEFTNGVWPFYRNDQSHLVRRECPYGKIGDVLWVRETCLWVMRDHAHDLLEGAKDNNQWVYKASVHNDFISYAKEQYGYKWKPSIYMPFEAARIFLEITNIRVERLQDISNSDAINEGIEYLGTGDYGPEWKCYFNIQSGTAYTLPMLSFASLWKSINGLDSWNANPWVWVVEFKRIENP